MIRFIIDIDYFKGHDRLWANTAELMKGIYVFAFMIGDDRALLCRLFDKDCEFSMHHRYISLKKTTTIHKSSSTTDFQYPLK